MLLRETIDRLCLERIGRAPNIASPRGYNDSIQWLKLHDQRPEHVTCCDKWAVREWVRRRAGAAVLIPARLDVPRGWPAVAKCTHDSGSARPVRSAADWPRALKSLKARLAMPYGVAKGEWAYRLVPPRVMAEDMLPTPVVDYKLHCSGGRIRWCQVIAGRSTGTPRETILDAGGKATGLHMDHKMVHAPAAPVYPGEEAWASLCSLARRLAEGWRYVRVDLYSVRGRALFGELTFWPLAGCYLTSDEPRLGDMLQLDLSYRMEPIVP